MSGVSSVAYSKTIHIGVWGNVEIRHLHRVSCAVKMVTVCVNEQALFGPHGFLDSLDNRDNAGP